MRKALFLLGIFVCASLGATAQGPTQGLLNALSKEGRDLGSCPLKKTNVTADISGFVTRVRVVQEFENSFSQPIEAVYVFPLSQNGAVDDMTMTIGARVVRGRILKREEARKAYEAAKSEGRAASLLDQERPNIFTQSVANIMPGESVKVEISYVETLQYEDGSYEFVFPMTVGPRYNPASVADKSKITPPIAATRPGHDISISVNLNAGIPVQEIRSDSHEIHQINLTSNAAKVSLKDEKVIPNKDFVLRYDVTGKRIEDAVLTHRSERGGFFTMILQPPDRFVTEDRTPKEIVFVLDTSGSMYGFPIEKAKEAMKLSLDGLYPNDTFNLITFAGDTSVLFDEPVPATKANLEKAQAFLDTRSGGGGTEMMKAIKAALDPSDANDHLRIVCFMTDGYVGNENEIIAEIQRHPQARVFSFGIGSSVNRFLLDKMAEAGKGEVEYVALEDDGSKAARRFYERVRTPLLTDLSIEWNGMPVADVYPSRLTDLFSAKPVIVNGRFTKAAAGTIKLRGKVAGQPYEREIAVSFPETEPANDSLASLWARKRIDQLSSDALNSKDAAAVNKQITDLGLEFRLLTQFTSFVAVEERIVNQNGTPVKVEVPIAIPDGVDINMAVGDGQTVVNVTGSGSGSGSGVGYGSGGGVGNLPASPRQISGGVLNASSAMVTVTSSESAIDTTDSSITTTIRPDSNGNFRVVTRSGGGGGGGAERKDEKRPKAAKPTPPTPEQLRVAKLKATLHTWLYDLSNRFRVSQYQLTANESLFVRDGKAAIRIVLTGSSPELIEKLKAAGFEPVSEKGNTLIGRVAVEKLAALAVIEEVKYILPAI
ncbi:MAG: VIT and VWA domain-containing protein [Pyrinomonadaceae bacterium]